MSLKVFHIFFIAVSTLFAFGFSIWLVSSYNSTGNLLQLLAAILSLLAGVGLILYAIQFLRKLKHVG